MEITDTIYLISSNSDILYDYCIILQIDIVTTHQFCSDFNSCACTLYIVHMYTFNYVQFYHM